MDVTVPGRMAGPDATVALPSVQRTPSTAAPVAMPRGFRLQHSPQNMAHRHPTPPNTQNTAPEHDAPCALPRRFPRGLARRAAIPAATFDAAHPRQLDYPAATDDDRVNSRIDEAVLALPYLGIFERNPVTGARTWKSFDWSAMDRLHGKGLISDPVSKARSVALTDTGLHQAEAASRRRATPRCSQPHRRTLPAGSTRRALHPFVPIAAHSIAVGDSPGAAPPSGMRIAGPPCAHAAHRVRKRPCLAALCDGSRAARTGDRPRTGSLSRPFRSSGTGGRSGSCSQPAA